MNFEISREDFRQAKDFIESGELVKLMGVEGLSFGAMALILDALFKQVESLEEKFNEEV